MAAKKTPMTTDETPETKPKKTPCPITRAQFREAAKAVKLTLLDWPFWAGVKEFSTGSLGWYANEKGKVEVGGVPVKVQIGLSITIVGSKELPQE